MVAKHLSGFVATADNPVPAGGEAIVITAPDGAPLRLGWFPALKRQRGHVILMPGRTEFIEKYFEVVGELQRRGFDVLCVDWRGQGGSARMLDDPNKGHINKFSIYCNDLACCLEFMGRDRLRGPRLLLAHSMGGAIALKYLQSQPPSAAGVVLSAPMTGLAQAAPTRLAARLLSGLAGPLGYLQAYTPGGAYDPKQEAFKDNRLTHDRRRFQRALDVLAADPALAVAGPTFGWLQAAYQCMDEIIASENIKKVDAPVLLLSAPDDALVDAASHRRLAALLPHATYVSLDGARHELMMETDVIQDRFWVEFDGFVAPLVPAES